MEQESDPDDVERLAKEEQQRVYHHRIVGMQKVEVNATPVGLENRTSHQMVQIHQHRSKENQINPLPLVSKESVSNA